jgi:1,2-dihydroxy-3-keto-5-methylthiopentene dioxygenase
MSAIVIFSEAAPDAPIDEAHDASAIAERLKPIGVRFEQWAAAAALAPGATPDEILAAYGADVERLKREGGYQSADVIRLSPDPSDPGWPAKAAAARQKFRDEHTHAEDEVRFFVEGSGVFYLHAAGKVHAVLCEQGDLISVPAGTRHWFDMGESPRFCAIRLFLSPDGWVASFTGDKLARAFPDHASISARAP